MRALPLARPRVGSVLLAGFAASLAYLAAQWTDRRLTGNRYDDLLLWGGLLSGQPRRQRVLGAGVHFTLGLSLAALYDMLPPLASRMPGPLRGMLFAQMENTLAYPGVPLIDGIHPEVRGGALPSLTTRQYWAVETVRHAAYGAVLGALLPVRERR